MGVQDRLDDCVSLEPVYNTATISVSGIDVAKIVTTMPKSSICSKSTLDHKLVLVILSV